MLAYVNKELPKNEFTLCFNDHGGQMALGGPANVERLGSQGTTKLKESRTFYHVDITKMVVGGKDLGASSSSYNS